jgi:hypothetical protein
MTWQCPRRRVIPLLWHCAIPDTLAILRVETGEHDVGLRGDLIEAHVAVAGFPTGAS